MNPPSGLDAWRHNAFFVLEMPVSASRAELERAGQKLLALLELGTARARTCQTPLGVIERDADMVRAALATLRDPEKRAVAELWAKVAPQDPPPDTGLAPWVDAKRVVGWRA